MCAGAKNQGNSNKTKASSDKKRLCHFIPLFWLVILFKRFCACWRTLSLCISKSWESQTELCVSPDPELTADVSVGELMSLSLTTFLRELLWVSDEIQSR